jgi:hypothetical protein
MARGGLGDTPIPEVGWLASFLAQTGQPAEARPGFLCNQAQITRDKKGLPNAIYLSQDQDKHLI